MRSRSKKNPVDFRTKCLDLSHAKRHAKEWLKRRAEDPVVSRKGGGTLEALAAIYLATPKRTQPHVATNNISRLRVICRAVCGRDLAAVTCREIGPEFWQRYQRLTIEAKGFPFDLATRRRGNIPINAAVRAARCLFLPTLLTQYRAQGLDVRADASTCAMLPEPYVAPTIEKDDDIVAAWRALPRGPLWLTIGLARFAGLRRDEIANLRPHWIEEKNGGVSIFLCDRPDDGFLTKTGKPYRAQVIDPEVADYLRQSRERQGFLIPDPDGMERAPWFERVPQRWLHAQGIKSAKPLHRLRGLYADHISQLTADAVAARLAGVRAAQEALGHTNSATTEGHYLTPDALR